MMRKNRGEGGGRGPLPESGKGKDFILYEGRRFAPGDPVKVKRHARGGKPERFEDDWEIAEVYPDRGEVLVWKVEGYEEIEGSSVVMQKRKKKYVKIEKLASWQE